MNVFLIYLNSGMNIEKRNEKWIRYFFKTNKLLVFSYLYLVKRMKKRKDRKLICLVEKKNEIGINLNYVPNK